MLQIFIGSPPFRALLYATLLLGAASRGMGSPYTITDLNPAGGTLLGSDGAFLNNLGQVAGTWTPGGSDGYPYFYDPTAGGRVTLLGITSPSGQNPGSYGAAGAYASGLNDLGQIVGWNAQGSFVYNSATGTTTSVPGSPGLVTNSGQIIETYPVATIQGWGNFHPYSYQNRSLQDLGTPPGTVGAEVKAVNNAGQVLVHAAVTPGDFSHSFLLSNGKWTDLGAFYAAAINDKGTIAGDTGYVPGQLTHAAIIPPGGTPIDIGTLPGDTFSSAYGINNHGQVVGLSFKSLIQNGTNLYQGFLYQNGVMTNLNSLIPANSGWTIRWGLSINDSGQILAYADNSANEELVLLTPSGLPTPPAPIFPAMPVPEPSTLVVFAFLGSAFAWRASRKFASQFGMPDDSAVA